MIAIFYPVVIVICIIIRMERLAVKVRCQLFLCHLNFIRGYHYEGDCIGEPIYGSVEMVIDVTDYIENNCPIVEDPVIRTFPIVILQSNSVL